MLVERLSEAMFFTFYMAQSIKQKGSESKSPVVEPQSILFLILNAKKTYQKTYPYGKKFGMSVQKKFVIPLLEKPPAYATFSHIWFSKLY